jgi:protein dithiol:quinone oxidoreductase
MMRGHPADRTRLSFLSFVSMAALTAAVYTQYAWGMDPCSWCVLQRILMASIALVAMASALWPRRSAGWVHRAAAFAIGGLAILGGASALWQSMVAAKSSSCNLTMADRVIGFTQLDRLLPDLFLVRASCAEASQALFGVPYPVWSLVAFIAIAVMAVRIHLDQRHRVIIRDSGGLAA